MKNHIVAAVVAGGLIAPAFFSSAVARSPIMDDDVAGYPASAPMRNPNPPTVLFKVGSWQHDRFGADVLLNVRLDNRNDFAVKDLGVACAQSAAELTTKRQGDFSIPGIIRPRSSVRADAIEVGLIGTDKICEVVSFTPFLPGSPMAPKKEDSEHWTITTKSRSFYIPWTVNRM